ncbi:MULTISPECIES: hypothetical protein [Bacillaceae]|uniref:hypothetical protein n=1 Tax=Bacillaceae TaxID=186817 RepID=UPI0006AF89FE|nr:MULTISPECIES: hypothetical protein [Bacillaceae]ALC84679.1 hypothetical protein AM499_01785 [Bacillus sp. FJAT-22090]KQL32573.1 hypothetical protein AN959_18535 [Psychrobacillus sp. FJAT-21963]MDF2067924.1 hypothetical protein [Bacillus sp. Cr_A10]
MARNWMRLCIASLAVLLLVGCSSVEEQAEDGMENAKEVFQGDAEKPNKTVDNLKIFLPSGFSIEDDSDQTNIILSKGNDSYILFVNPNELPGSQLYYDLMMDNKNLKIVEKDTFEQNGRFGFAAIIESSEENFELIASIGGIKLTTISKQQDIASNIEKMMMIVRSISTD